MVVERILLEDFAVDQVRLHDLLRRVGRELCVKHAVRLDQHDRPDRAGAYAAGLENERLIPEPVLLERREKRLLNVLAAR